MNNRLLKISNIAGEVDSLIDIGTDHGYLPVYLIESKQAKQAIVSDISKDSLDKAIKLAKQKKMTSFIDARVGSGFSVLDDKEHIELAVIAGMGGNLIAEIIHEKVPYLKRHHVRMILQPMQNAEALRSYLLSNGFYIKNEYLVKEDKFIYQILEVLPGNNIHCYDEVDLAFGKKDLYFEEEQHLYKELLMLKKTELQTIINKIDISGSNNKQDLIRGYEQKIKMIEGKI